MLLFNPLYSYLTHYSSLLKRSQGEAGPPSAAGPGHGENMCLRAAGARTGTNETIIRVLYPLNPNTY
jgi:hypothetical protein